MSVIFRRHRRSMAVIAAASVIALGLTACQSSPNGGTADGTETVTLRAVTAWDSATTSHYLPFMHFVEALEAQGDTGIKIEILGGPDTMPASELAENLANGTIDIAYNTASYYSNTIPEALVLSLTNLTPEEWRERGLFDQVNEWHVDQLNQRVLGRFGGGQSYALYTANPINSLADFEKMRIRGASVYLGLLNQLGAEMVDMPASDIYTGIERGTVSGTAWPEPGVSDLSLQEVIKYVILPSFYSNGMALYINEGVWEKLSDSQRKAMEKAVLETESWAPGFTAEYRDKERAILADAGVEITELSPSDAKEYLAKAAAGAIDVLVTLGVDRKMATTLIDQFND